MLSSVCFFFFFQHFNSLHCPPSRENPLNPLVFIPRWWYEHSLGLFKYTQALITNHYLLQPKCNFISK